jgi:mannose-1-phosphate guanylyltransferase / mannose-6-phosphate isomerase
VIVPVIVCGGQGTRLWPYSRKAFPKQFICFSGEHSTFQKTVLRVANSELFAPPLVVASHEHRFLVRKQLEGVGVEAVILLEPEPRDSGPAMLAAAVFQERAENNTAMLILAADHYVNNDEAFLGTCSRGVAAAQSGYIVTFGIPAKTAAIQYGYIEVGGSLDNGAYKVDRFVEKPDLSTARDYQQQGLLWNSGNFMVRPDILIEEYNRNSPNTVDFVRKAVTEAKNDLGFVVLDASAFAMAEKTSIDYAVMEKTDRAAVVKANFDWSDLGSWSAYWELNEKDEFRNAFASETEAIDSSGNFTLSEDVLVSLLGVKDLVVVATRDAILVADRARAEDVKVLVDKLRKGNRIQADEHIRCYRPWGWYQRLDSGPRFQVKRIVVYPGGRLSLQKHFHRAEHWIVVRGTALITNEDRQTLLGENESTFIPLGHVHRLENPGKIDLELIEVQSGSYLGEDDIERLEDIYARA